MTNKKRLIDQFLKLVRIDSESFSERRVVDYLKKELKKLGLKVKEDNAGRKIGGNAGNIFAYLKRSKRKRFPRVMLNAHVDTVTPGKGIKCKIKAGKIYSDDKTILGGDDKAGVAVILETLRVIKEEKVPHGDIQVVFTVAEEKGLLGAKEIKKKDLAVDFGFALDGGNINEIINRAPSQVWVKATVLGKAAHAGVHPEEGINAIAVASSAIAKMKLGRIDRETTANIGLIKGGTATNIVPERVEIKGDARSHQKKKLQKQVAHMRKALQKACRSSGAKLKFQTKEAYRSFNVSSKAKIIALVQKAVKSIGLKPKIKSSGGGSDANIFNALGVPTIIIGAGMKKVHTTKEYVRPNDMAKSGQLVLEIIKQI